MEHGTNSRRDYLLAVALMIMFLHFTTAFSSDDTPCFVSHCLMDPESNAQVCIPVATLCVQDIFQDYRCTPLTTAGRDSSVRCVMGNETGVAAFQNETVLNSVITTYEGYNLHVDNETILIALHNLKTDGVDPDRALLWQSNASGILLGNKGINRIDEGAFRGFEALRGLDISNNNITRIDSGTFAGLSSLDWLFMSNNITRMDSETFAGLSLLQWLFMSNNNITRMDSETFAGLSLLQWLDISNNNIMRIESETFAGLSSLWQLDINNNTITRIDSETFAGLSSLWQLDISYNPISRIDTGAFMSLQELQYLFMVTQRSELKYVQSGSLDGLHSLEKMSTSDNRLCCLVNENVTCARTAQSSPLDTCGSIFPSIALRIAGWMMGFSALVGNGVVLYIRLRKRSGDHMTQNKLIVSLALADCFMGIYMIIITAADIYYGKEYFLRAPKWRESALCNFAGFIGMLSSEASVFTLTLITIDRFICIMYPFGKYKLGPKKQSAALAVIWMITVVICLFSACFATTQSRLYGLSDVCIGLPLQTVSEVGELVITGNIWNIDDYDVSYISSDVDKQPMWWFSIVIFIFLNLISFGFILACYVAMFIKVSRSGARVRNSSTQKREVKLAKRMALIIGTDFACWMPVIVMGILSQTGLVDLSSSLYAWTVILIIPINSSLNPFLYTFIVYI